MSQLTPGQLQLLEKLVFLGVVFMIMNIVTPLIVTWLKLKFFGEGNTNNRRASDSADHQTFTISTDLIAKYVNAYEHDVKARTEMMRAMNAHLDEEKKQTPLIAQIHQKVVMDGKAAA